MPRLLLLPALALVSLSGCVLSTTVATGVSPAGSDVDVLGVWAYNVASPGGGDEGTFTITGEPGEYEGEIIAQGDLIPLSDISVSGNELSFQFRVGNGPLVRCAGVVTVDEFKGIANAGSYGAFPMMASR
ncbi:MAG: hypothetical protein AAF791_13280 [Bacteroidota bacterium]